MSSLECKNAPTTENVLKTNARDKKLPCRFESLNKLEDIMFLFGT